MVGGMTTENLAEPARDEALPETSPLIRWASGCPPEALIDGAIPPAAVAAMRAELADLDWGNLLEPEVILDPADVSDAEVLTNIHRIYRGCFGSGVCGFVADWYAGQDAAGVKP